MDILFVVTLIYLLYRDYNKSREIKSLTERYSELYTEFYDLNGFTRGILDSRNLPKYHWQKKEWQTDYGKRSCHVKAREKE